MPGNEGRAGMVALVDTNNELNVGELAKELKKNLPAYAVPIFLRVMESVPLTGTFKLKKTDLQKEGFDIDLIKDRVYTYDPKNVTYVELNREKYEEIVAGNVRL